ncbi:MAG: hypothetical protein KKH28_00845 [Elusimicrobia bacterium]|nr:hypothetical protein [Elusimicrobiota bacterium]
MKYWAYVNNEILGPYEKEKLFKLPVFSPSTLICPQTPVGEKTEDWKEASTYPEIAALLNSPGGPALKKLETASSPNQTQGSQLQLEPIVSPKAGTPMERSQPVFNSEEPQIKLKSLSPSSIEQAPPRSMESGNINIGVTRMEHPGDAHKSDLPQDSPKTSGSSFDPLTISQIGRRADTPFDGTSKSKTPAPEMFNPPEIAAPTPASPEPPANAAPVAPAPAAPEPAASAPVASAPVAPEPVAPEPAAPEPVAPTPPPKLGGAPEAVTSAAPQGTGDAKALNEIKLRLENLATNSLSKQDLAGHLDPLKEKLSQMGEVLSAIKNSQFQREIMDKMQYFENALSDIKASLTQPSAAVTAAPVKPPAVEKEPAAATVYGVQPPKSEPAQPAPDTPDKAEIVDQGSSAKSSKLGGGFKKALKAIATIVLLVAVLGVAAFVLKNFGIFDITKFIPLPFLGAPEETAPAPQTFPPQSLEPQAQSNTPAEPQQQPQKPASPDEIIYFARNYSPEKGGGKMLENSIFEDAARRKANFIKAAWTAKELPGGTFEASAAIPMMRGKGRLVYSYEIDYAKKTIKALDDQSKNPLDALSLEKLQPKAPAKVKKSRKGKGKASAPKAAPKQAKPAAKKVAPKVVAPAADDEDEYEYVYEDVYEDEYETGGE